MKFFRSIRKKLLSENKFTKYISYAIGEITLVVIGILIALNINISNEKKQNKAIINNALKEIQTNLITDIEQAQNDMAIFLRLDATKDSILSDAWSAEDYATKSSYDLVGYYSHKFILNEDGFQTLMNHIDKLPLKYEPILQDLRSLYVKRKAEISQANDRLVSVHYEAVDEVFQQDWYLLGYSDYNEFAKRRADYYMSSDYKKYIISYMNDRAVLLEYSQKFHLKAVETYLKIDSLLNNKKSALPTKYLTSVTEEEYGKYMGHYGFSDSSYISKVYIQDDAIYNSSEDSNNKHYKVNDNLFIVFEGEDDTANFQIWQFVGDSVDDYGVEVFNYNLKLKRLGD